MTENILQQGIELVLPYIINLLEIMGIVVVAWSGILAFSKYVKSMFTHKRINFMFAFSRGLCAGLQFKMAAEILKTVLIKEISELVVLGAVILLRSVLVLVIHFEIKNNKDRE